MIGALLAARACAQAYDHVDLVAGEAKALTVPDRSAVLVAFQGTHDVAQALEDLDVRPRFMAGVGYVHHGFSELAEAAFPLVRDLAIEIGKPLVLAGHSLGGAVALLVGALLVRANLPPATVLAFGAPRISVGAAVGRVYRRDRTPLFLYRHGADLVPELPPVFSHPAELIQIGPPGDGIEDGIADHAIDRYVAALEAA